ncbi:MAG TPA: sugar ABC transporter permease [Ruminiclostridium sp.]
MDRFLGDRKAICIFVLPALLLFSILIILPIFFSLFYSTLDWNGVGDGIFIGLKNFERLIISNTDGFTKSIKNSFVLAGLSIFIQLPIALTIALTLARGVKGARFFRTVYFVPVIISTVVIGQLWMKVYHPDYGLLNILLRSIGLDSLTNQWLGNAKTALLAVFIPIVWQYVGYHMLLMYAAAKSVPDEIYESARIDGANEITIALKISIPLIKPMLRVCVIFATIGAFKSFDLIYVLTNGGPMHATDMPTTLMYNTIFVQGLFGYGSAMAIFVIVECFTFTLVIQKIFGKVNV